MTHSFTGIAYLLGFLVISILSYKVFIIWQKKKNIVSKILFYAFISLGFFMLITAIGGLFFTLNSHALKQIVVLSIIVQNFGLAAIAYLIVYLRIPKISPLLSSAAVFIFGTITVIWINYLSFSPYLDESGGINWDTQGFLLINLLRLFLLTITFLPFCIILIQQAKTTADPDTKKKALYFSLMVIFGIIIGVFDFVLEPFLGFKVISSDFAVFSLSGLILIFLFLSERKAF